MIGTPNTTDSIIQGKFGIGTPNTTDSIIQGKFGQDLVQILTGNRLVAMYTLALSWITFMLLQWDIRALPHNSIF